MDEHTINRLGHLGDGIADGPLYAALTAPGDVVSGNIAGDRLHDVRILRPSDDRVAAPCRHFKGCGGCMLQHLTDTFVAEWKADIVRQSLQNVRLETDIRPTITSPSRSRRRATFAARRTKKGALVGFHGRASDTIVPVPDCILVVPELLSALPLAEALAIEGASRKGVLSIAVTLTRGGLDVFVQGGKPLDGPLRVALAQLAETHRVSRLTWEDETIALRAPPEIAFDGVFVTPPPGAFLQATQDGQDSLIACVLDIVRDAPSVVELFAGCGTFALPLSKRGAVLAVEGDAEMLKALDQGWRKAQGLKRTRTEKRDLFRNPMLADELNRFAAIVMDPPRAGAESQVAQIAKCDVPVIAHVSCNPITFARDARTLVDAGYELRWVQPVDQFRWSPHTELVAAFHRKD